MSNINIKEKILNLLQQKVPPPPTQEMVDCAISLVHTQLSLELEFPHLRDIEVFATEDTIQVVMYLTDKVPCTQYIDIFINKNLTIDINYCLEEISLEKAFVALLLLSR